MDIRFTPSARSQFLDEVTRLLDSSRQAADTFISSSEKALDRLRSFPDSGHPLPEFPAQPYRQVLVGLYRFFYRRKGDTIWIVGVWHHRQDAGIDEAGRE